jgi:hypothetical protein
VRSGNEEGDGFVALHDIVLLLQPYTPNNQPLLDGIDMAVEHVILI